MHFVCSLQWVASDSLGYGRYFREGYLNAMAELIQRELQKFDNPEKTEIFFSAHGVPVSYVEQDGDPYRDEMEQCVGMIMDELSNRGWDNKYSLAYQSRVGPVGLPFVRLRSEAHVWLLHLWCGRAPAGCCSNC